MPDEHNPIWLLYPLSLLGQKGTCLVYSNATEAGGPRRQVRVTLILPVEPAPENELGSRQDRDYWTAFVESIEEDLAKACDALWVGQLREVGAIKACYYCHTPPPTHTQDLIRQKAQRPLNVEITDDPHWDFYHQRLAPTPLARDWCNNSMVENALRSSGDPLIAPREITFAAHFPTAQAAQDYCIELNPMGFRTAEPTRQRGGLFKPSRWWVQATLQDIPTADNITPVTFELGTIAAKHGGTFDGWESAMAT